jgi:type IV secretory pathway TraG/TraD family ATPase VirD4
MPHKLIYEPGNPNSTPYNIFGSIDQIKNKDDQNEALEQLAFLMMSTDEKMTDTSKFFNTEGRKILTASLIAFYHKQMDFIEICEKIVNSSWKDLFSAIDATENNKARSGYQNSNYAI